MYDINKYFEKLYLISKKKLASYACRIHRYEIDYEEKKSQTSEENNLGNKILNNNSSKQIKQEDNTIINSIGKITQKQSESIPYMDSKKYNSTMKLFFSPKLHESFSRDPWQQDALGPVMLIAGM